MRARLMPRPPGRSPASTGVGGCGTYLETRPEPGMHNFRMSAYRPVEEELHALLDAAVEGIVVIDHLGRIQAFNRSAERLFGYQAREVLDRNVNLLMNEPDGVAHDGHLARYVATRGPHIIGNGRGVSARRKDGSVFP